MHHADVRKCAEALAKKTLPILPGDMLLFSASGHRMLVVCCGEQTKTNNGIGQHIAGLTSTSHACNWQDFYIEWAGIESVWSIVRLS